MAQAVSLIYGTRVSARFMVRNEEALEITATFDLHVEAA